MKRATRKRHTLLSFGVFLFLSLLGALFIPLGSPKSLDASAGQDLVMAQRLGRLRGDQNGVIPLSASVRGLSATGCAYGTTEANGRVLFIPSWIGRTTLFSVNGDLWTEGYLYDPGPDKGLAASWEVVSAAQNPFWRLAPNTTTRLTVISLHQFGSGWYGVATVPS